MVVTSISGKDVPIETIVNPITTSGIPPLRARPLAPSMKKSAETTNNPNASIRINIVIAKLFEPKLEDSAWLAMIPINKAPRINRVLNCKS